MKTPEQWESMFSNWFAANSARVLNWPQQKELARLFAEAQQEARDKALEEAADTAKKIIFAGGKVYQVYDAIMQMRGKK